MTKQWHQKASNVYTTFGLSNCNNRVYLNVDGWFKSYFAKCFSLIMYYVCMITFKQNCDARLTNVCLYKG